MLDDLSDADLEALNSVLPWSCFTTDGNGRRFGQAAWRGKRDVPQQIPDYRGVLLDKRFNLSDKEVLEIGCFEGVHTVGLCQWSRKVTAVDARIENVVKTIVRCAFYGVHPEVRVCNVEETGAMARFRADIVHHVGVLYHLRDPIEHLLAVGVAARHGLLLDTHVAEQTECTGNFVVDGRSYPYRQFAEGGVRDVFSGMYSHAKWLTLEAIVDLLREAGFATVDLIESRSERNGARVLLMAEKG